MRRLCKIIINGYNNQDKVFLSLRKCVCSLLSVNRAVIVCSFENMSGVDIPNKHITVTVTDDAMFFQWLLQFVGQNIPPVKLLLTSCYTILHTFRLCRFKSMTERYLVNFGMNDVVEKQTSFHESIIFIQSAPNQISFCYSFLYLFGLIY